MARRRFFVEGVRGGAAELRGEEARHLTRVLRAEPGRRYEIVDRGAVYLAEIAEVGRERVVFRLLEPLSAEEPPVRLTLVAALIKFDRFEWLVEKATELGVERILPVEAARSERGLLEAAGKRIERWRKIARESSQQARRSRLPEIGAPVRLDGSVAREAGYRYVLEEAGAMPMLAALPDQRRPFDLVAILSGPEGGWTGGEREALRAAAWQPVSLGRLILRAETAGVAAAAVLTSAWQPLQ